MTVETWRPSLV